MSDASDTTPHQDDTTRFRELGTQVSEASKLYDGGCEELLRLAKERATGLMFALGEQVQQGAFEAEGLINAIDMIAEETAALLPDEVRPDFRAHFQQIERAFLSSWACT